MKTKIKEKLKKCIYWSPMILVGLMLFINALSLLYPLVWGFITSFKDVFDYTLNPNGLPEIWHWENWTSIISGLKVQLFTSKGLVVVGFGQMFITTVVWAVFHPLLGIIFGVLVAYIIAIYQNAFTKFLYQLGIVLMCLVVVGTFPAQMTLYKKWGIYDNMLMMILISPQGGFSGFTFLLYYNLFRAVPREFAEAAEMDGAGQFTVMCVAYIPFVFTTALVYYIMGIMGSWNDYGTFLIWLPSYANLSYGMYVFNSQFTTMGATFPQVLSGFFVVAIPSAVMYLCLDKQLVAKLRVTGLK